VRPDQQEPTAMSAAYFTDEQGLPTLGLKLTAGRNFRPDEITDLDPTKPLNAPAAVIVTRALAERLFPAGKALGQRIIILPGSSTQIIGVVDQLQVPWVNAAGWGSTFSENSALLPFRLVAQQSMYVIQTRPGAMSDVMRSAQKTLLQLDRNRILETPYSLQDARAKAYQDDRGLAVLLASISAVLLVITALGIVGLTSYWVTQRRRHIGIQRALGATRPAVVRYFQTENLLIAGTGAAVGIALAISINLWMISNYEMQRLTGVYLIVGAAIVLVLGQLAAFYPALRAASVPPAIAARG
jgi:putative ABC transport system permease protein